jgi:cobyrinic acid a,c-diamide synthase
MVGSVSNNLKKGRFRITLVNEDLKPSFSGSIDYYHTLPSKPRIVVAGTASDCGKTTVATGLMGALVKKGIAVQGFKVGPDYLDPSYHSRVTGRPSRNLDTWLMGEHGVCETFRKATLDADMAVIEGVMGLFDGSASTSDEQTTAEIARLLKSPAILVVDAHAVGRSVAAQVLGFSRMARGFEIKGVILNRIGSERHFLLCKEAIEHETSISVIGHLRFDKELELPSRHLGLHSATKEVDDKIQMISKFVEESTDLDSIRSIATEAPEVNLMDVNDGENDQLRSEPASNGIRIGVALDESFSFYYEDNLDELRRLGANIRFFSPIHDRELPEVDLIYIGGGYPEINAELLEKNNSMRHEIHKSFEDGMPIYAECGGLMYLGRETTSVDGKRHKMAGVFDLDTKMTQRLRLGYTEMESVSDTPISTRQDRLYGHEFHYSSAENVSSDCKFAFRLIRGKGIARSMDGCMSQSALGCFGHLHFCRAKKGPRRLVELAQQYFRK